MFGSDYIESWVIKNNSKKIQYVLLFLIFLLAFSYRMFDHLFGTTIKHITKNMFLRHFISLLFLYLIIDIQIEGNTQKYNPIISIIISIIIYFLTIVLLHGNQIYIAFIMILVFILIVMDKYQNYLANSIQDEENKQDKLEFIYKTNNIFIILMILTITIGSTTSLDIKQLKKVLHFGKANN